MEELLTPANGDLLDAFLAAHGIASWGAISALADSGARRNVVQRLVSIEVQDFNLDFFDGQFGLGDKGVRVAMQPPFMSVLGNVCLPEDLATCAANEVELAAAEVLKGCQ